MSNRLIHFNKTKGGDFFEIRRTDYTTDILKNIPLIKPNNRRGIGNKHIERENFSSEPPKPRSVQFEVPDVSFELGAKTLDKFFNVMVPDPTDKEWLNEKKRRLALGETEEDIMNRPPLGRKQREIKKASNFADSTLKFKDQVEQINISMRKGFGESKQTLSQIMLKTAQILSDVKQLEGLTFTETKNLQNSIDKMGIPFDYKMAGFTHRYFTLKEYLEKSGLINLFLLSNISKFSDRKLQEPVLIVSRGEGKRYSVPITQLASAMKRRGVARPGKFLDLKTRGIYHFEDIIPKINSGQDNGLINGRRPKGGADRWVMNKFVEEDFYDYKQKRIIIPEGMEDKVQ